MVMLYPAFRYGLLQLRHTLVQRVKTWSLTTCGNGSGLLFSHLQRALTHFLHTNETIIVAGTSAGAWAPVCLWETPPTVSTTICAKIFANKQKNVNYHKRLQLVESLVPQWLNIALVHFKCVTTPDLLKEITSKRLRRDFNLNYYSWKMMYSKLDV